MRSKRKVSKISRKMVSRGFLSRLRRRMNAVVEEDVDSQDLSY
jgi:hypothetical protein